MGFFRKDKGIETPERVFAAGISWGEQIYGSLQNKSRAEYLAAVTAFCARKVSQAQFKIFLSGAKRFWDTQEQLERDRGTRDQLAALAAIEVFGVSS